MHSPYYTAEAEPLSGVELYYAEDGWSNDHVVISGDDVKHITKVMRHGAGDIVYATDGRGLIVRAVITAADRDKVEASIEHRIECREEFPDIVFCLPKMKSQDRFEFALEKCIELGVTRFIVYDAARSIAKGNRDERWNRIALAAMKQSLRAFKPVIETGVAFEQLAAREGTHILLDQAAEKPLSTFTAEGEKTYYLLIGPGGGFEDRELQALTDAPRFAMSQCRLRVETAAAAAAVYLTGSVQIQKE